MEENPFPDLQISDTSVVESAAGEGRTHCPQCHRKRKYFCYNCCVFVNDTLQECAPRVKLPLQVLVVKHRRELDSKSTACHACLLAREGVSIFIYPDKIPSFNPDTDVLLFPSDSSMTVEEWAEAQSATIFGASDEICCRPAEPHRVVFIDSTWHLAKEMLASSHFSGLRHIKLKSYSTKFWRPNGEKRTEEYLATIEAIYYCVREYHTHFLHQPYSGQYDNLLFLFKFLYLKIKDYHHGGTRLRAYRRKPLSIVEKT